MTQEQVMAQTIGAMLGGPVGAAVGLAASVAKAVQTVDAVLEVLAKSAETLKAVGMMEVDVNDFGASWAGTNLGTHARKAQTNVIQQLEQQVDGLLRYRADLIQSEKDWGHADQVSSEPFRNLDSMTACVAENFTTESGRELDERCAPGENG